VIVFGIGQGIGNIIQAESAIACLRAKGLKVYITKNCTWEYGWRVLDGRVDGYVDIGDPDVKHFMQGCWYRPIGFPYAKIYYVPYEPINQVDLHWKVAKQFYSRQIGKDLALPNPPKLSVQWKNEDQKYVAVHPARTLNNVGWKLKLYEKWDKLIHDLLNRGIKVKIVGTKIDCEHLKNQFDESMFFDEQGFDIRLPLEYADFLKRNCKALITSASGWAFMGAAIGISILSVSNAISTNLADNTNMV